MEKCQMKNIVVLKNLPSNLVEEALVIFKTNKYAKKYEYIEKNENIKKEENNKNSKDYIIREAESVLTNYINSVEKKEKINKNNRINKKYKRLKVYSIVVSFLLILSLVV